MRIKLYSHKGSRSCLDSRTLLGSSPLHSHKASRSCLDSRTWCESSSSHTSKGSCSCLDSRTWCGSSSIHTRAHALVSTTVLGAGRVQFTQGLTLLFRLGRLNSQLTAESGQYPLFPTSSCARGGLIVFFIRITASDSAMPKWAVVCGSNPLRQSRRGRV